MLVPASTLLIAAKPTPHMPVLWATLALVGILLVGAVVIELVKRWRERVQRQERQSAGDQLSHFRTLYERGELSREEYERIRALLSERLREDLQLPGHAPAAPPVPPGAVQAGPEPAADPRPEEPPPETGIRNGPPTG